MSRHVTAAAMRTVAPGVLSILAFLFLVVSHGWLGYPLLCLALLVSLVASLATHRRPPAPDPDPAGSGLPGADLSALLVLAAGVVAHAAQPPTRPSPAGLALTGVGLLGLLLLAPLLHRLARPWFAAAHLPARPGLPAQLVAGGGVWVVHSAAVAGAGLAAVLGAPGWWLAAPVIAAAAVTGWFGLDGLRRWRTGHRAELAVLSRAIAAHRPRFLLYFSAPPGSEYQVRMWLPYLERLEEPFFVLLAEPHHLRAVAAATTAPVVVCDTFQALDAVMVPSLRAAFYVNNGMKNAHCVRYAHLTHGQLYHGDSDKAVTASPLNQLYDRVFVAGQAAIDRFAAHGVEIPPDRFRIVGRPQVAELAVTEAPIREAHPQVVLYAPTWVGAHADSNYCSLPIAEQIVTGLLERGATVILRPHPYTERDRESAAALRRVTQLLAQDRTRTGRAHCFGRAATVERGLFDCMNAAHAMICDVSSVASDFLYTGKPFAITDMAGQGADFPQAFPVARAAYVVRRDAGNLPEVLADLLDADPLRATRHRLRTYYLGDIPAERYEQAFLAQARACVTASVRSEV